MLAAMLRQSGGGSGGGEGIGGGGGGGAAKLSLGIPRFSNSHFFPNSASTGTTGMAVSASSAGPTGSGSGPPGRGSKTRTLSTASQGSEGSDVPTSANPDYIMQLVSDVRKFADVLLHLKEIFSSKEHQSCLHQAVHERLGELLCVLKAVIGKHQSLNSVDILSAAGTVISRVKGVNFKEVNDDNKRKVFGEIYTAIDTLAFTFGNVVSDFLMGDVENGSALGLPLTKRSRSFENLSVESGGSGLEKDDPPGPSPPAPLSLSSARPEEVDGALQRSDAGVESALLYAKAWSKYSKELLAWVDRRLGMDIECAKSYAKMAESAKNLASQQEFMAFREIYMSAFKNDIEYSQLLLHTAAVLQSNKFMLPLQTRKSELDKLRKEVKEQWQRVQKKMHDADSALKKARLLQGQRQEEYEKAHSSASRAEEEHQLLLQQGGGGGGGGTVGAKLEKKRRLEEEALQKAEESREHCRACQMDVGVRRADMAATKSLILSQLREMVFQCDLTLKAVTVNWFQLQQAQVVSLPVNHQSLCERAKLYEPGQRYVQYISSLPAAPDTAAFHEHNEGSVFSKRPLTGSHSSHCNFSPASVTSDCLSADEVDSPVHSRPAKISECRSNSSTDIQALRIQGPFRPWASVNQGGGMCSDSESAGGSSESRSMDSPTASPGDFKRRLPRTPSTGTMSSADDLDDREPPSPYESGLNDMGTEMASSPGPFRNTQMSKAAQTHKLRKLRAPSKCRECDSLVVFHGAECEECSLACHKKCLETLAIQCGHKKLQGRLHLFGIDFTQASKDNPDGVPFIIRKCTSEIEARALNIKGIYRVNGAKSRVEKLCQAFENGKDLVELSELYPHDISNVLKLYLRQLPEPLILFRYYNDFIGLAKESQAVIIEELEASRLSPTPETTTTTSSASLPPSPLSPPSPPPQVSVELNRVLFKIKDLLRQLPTTYYKTLQFLIEHLHRVSERAEENKMTASNLGIIFGPTLIKPRQADAEVSLSSLVDYPYQALIVELLVRHYQMIFDKPLSPLPVSGGAGGEGQAHPRLTPQEKEQQLSRHSKSLGDIKEQSSKVYKRHSSIIPSSHLLAEVQETMPGLDRTDFEPAPDTDSTGNRANGPASPGVSDQRSADPRGGLSRSSYVGVSRVQLRHTRNKVYSRPASVPVDRAPPPAPCGQVDENNIRNRTANREMGACERPVEEEEEEEEEEEMGGEGGEVHEGFESPKSRLSKHYCSTFIDTQTLRRTWDKQYKQHGDAASRTTRAVACGSPPAEGLLSTSVPSACLAAYPLGGGGPGVPGRQYAVAVRPGRILRREDCVDEQGSGAAPFRAPRTLRPPPGTFYKPPPTDIRAKLLQRSLLANSAEEEEEEEEEEDDDEEELGIELEVSVDEPLDEDEEGEQGSRSSSSSSPEELGQNPARPLYQRLRPRRLQEVEHREAHFV
ncbi:Rho GTPase-activating protein 29 [Merluccius polli]|uniref:Rho GTPase-activating protein 29 n=1 Tax=Merluccius polli TaxID=89951 RepID=A0AA47M6V9_MERPO|nr:Rho GTPase-activating protein 29 [Merluccius polli]